MPASLGHVKLPVADLAASRRFYAGALAPLGFELVYESASSLGFGPPPFELLAVEVSHEPILGVHVAFDAADRGSVDAFHAAALAAGGRDNGAPGLRPQRSFPNDHAARPVIADGARAEPALLTVGAAESAPLGESYYAAFVLDPDGHNIEAVHHGARP